MLQFVWNFLQALDTLFSSRISDMVLSKIASSIFATLRQRVSTLALSSEQMLRQYLVIALSTFKTCEQLQSVSPSCRACDWRCLLSVFLGTSQHVSLSSTPASPCGFWSKTHFFHHCKRMRKKKVYKLHARFEYFYSTRPWSLDLINCTA